MTPEGSILTYATFKKVQEMQNKKANFTICKHTIIRTYMKHKKVKLYICRTSVATLGSTLFPTVRMIHAIP